MYKQITFQEPQYDHVMGNSQSGMDAHFDHGLRFIYAHACFWIFHVVHISHALCAIERESSGDAHDELIVKSMIQYGIATAELTNDCERRGVRLRAEEV